MDGNHILITLPLEIWTNIFSYVPRRERFICMCLSQRWKESMYAPCLWKHMKIHVEEVLHDVSTLQVTNEYCQYVKSLELCFENFSVPYPCIEYKMLEFSKRIYRFLSIFVHKNLQVNRLAFTHFCMFYKSKKILFYFNMFLRSQKCLRSISFHGSFFTNHTLIRLLHASMKNNSGTLRQLDIQNAYLITLPQMANGDFTHFSQRLLDVLSAIENLQILRVDFETLINHKLVNSILGGNFATLQKIDISVVGMDLVSICNRQLYSNKDWMKVKERLPTLKVSVNFYNIYEYESIDRILASAIPMFSLSWVSDTFLYNELVLDSFRKYAHSLESVRLCAKEHHMNKYIMFALEECPNLKCIEFTGTIENFCRMQECFLQAHFHGFQNYQLLLRSNPEFDVMFLPCEVIYKNSVQSDTKENYKILP